jgi:acetyl esterase/lipase
MPVLCIDYRKIPEHPHPAQIEDARSALLWLNENGPHGLGRASALFCAGDSAGGGLALGLGVSLRDNPIGSVNIAGIAVVSPMTDLTCSGESYTSRRWQEHGDDRCDPLFRGKDPARDSMREIYELMGKPGQVGSFKLTQPDISPLHADLHQFPPTLIQVGDAEVMLSDAVDFGAKAQAAGSPVEVKVYPRMWHCFNRFTEGCGTGVPLQEGIDAIKGQAQFMRQLSDTHLRLSDLQIKDDSSAPQSSPCLAMTKSARRRWQPKEFSETSHMT